MRNKIKVLNLSVLAYISLGSNCGDSKKNLRQALDKIAVLPYTDIVKISAVYHTEPQEDRAQAWFYNQAAAISTSLSPLELLHALQAIELSLGRSRSPGRRFGPRSMDLDILMYAGLTLNSPDLTLPHPRLAQRAFVLVPLVEVVSNDLLEGLEAKLRKIDYTVDGNRIFQS
ncbi:MAG: 2-amino-4-hydroxy-6-hydroxymethyldihydropteridine diphosphokinase [Deltaproteobacteria bacterium]|nr:2-amino-4-hydroxy-6-hydroxymethyldihydropteridine diphosphokinase [Deltaproteobacteria bacterium]